MTFSTIDRAKVTTTTTGTGNVVLDSAVSGYQDFAGVGDQNQTYYTIENGTEWETGIGTVLRPASSYYFSNNSSILVPGNSAFDFGAGNFTIECWIYPESLVTPSFQVILDAWNNSPTRFLLRINSGILQFFQFPGASQNINYTLPAANQWYHVAAVRNGTTTNLYVDGVSRGTPVTPGANSITSSTASWSISRVGAEFFQGYISNVRIVKGTALYTTGFTPPTSPLSVVSGTSILTCQSRIIVDNSSNAFTLTRSFQNTSSILFPSSITPSFSSYPSALERDIVFDSSNSGSLVNFSAGTKNVFIPQPAINTEGENLIIGNSSIDSELVAWKKLQKKIFKSVNGGATFDNSGVVGIISTFSTVIPSGAGDYGGGVLATNGDIHFIPLTQNKGQKISADGVVSTYSLVYTTSAATGTFRGGVLDPNGTIHFIPFNGNRGQRVSSSGVVSTYSLVYTATSIYGRHFGGVLAPNGDIHFVPSGADRGQKVSAAGVVSTYSLAYTKAGAYWGGVLAPNGDIHFVPNTANVGQKISAAGVVSTYSLVYTQGSGAYRGGVVAPNGDIHFIPEQGTVGQKVSISGVVSTYPLVYTGSSLWVGAVLSPTGDIHFIPGVAAARGQKISSTGIVSTYPLILTSASGLWSGGVLGLNGEIYFIPTSGATAQKLSTCPAIPFELETCLSPFFNKL